MRNNRFWCKRLSGKDEWYNIGYKFRVIIEQMTNSVFLLLKS